VPENFEAESRVRINSNAEDRQFRRAAEEFSLLSVERQYSYNFFWLGRPIIQYPTDIVRVQQLIWDVRPDLIIETGIAHGGSLMLSASMLELVSICGGPAEGAVLGIDIDIRLHNRAAIESHPLAHRIQMIEGSSTSIEVLRQVQEFVARYQRVMVFLDSNHSHRHVLDELNCYASFVSPGSYCVVFDTIVENLPKGTVKNRPWDRGDNPMTAVTEFLENDGRFEIDTSIDAQLMVSAAPRGYLRRVI